MLDTNGKGHRALAGILFDIGIDILIGDNAQNALTKAGIELCGGVSDECDVAVNAFLADNINFNLNVR